MSKFFDPETSQLWQEYLEAERTQRRQMIMLILDRFIDRLLTQQPEVWHAWAFEIARQTADEGQGTPVRFPLFRRVLLPVLVQGVRAGQPGCARWLAHFGLFLHGIQSQGIKTGLPEELTTDVGLLREALRVDSGDTIARQKLVEEHARYLSYTLHELPAGVLDCATIAQCDELLTFLGEFIIQVELLGERDKYEKLIEDCAFHFQSYRAYMLANAPGDSYEDYLENRQP